MIEQIRGRRLWRKGCEHTCTQIPASPQVVIGKRSREKREGGKGSLLGRGHMRLSSSQCVWVRFASFAIESKCPVWAPIVSWWRTDLWRELRQDCEQSRFRIYHLVKIANAYRCQGPC